MRKLEKELLHIKERVRRSRLPYWEKMECYASIRKLAKLLEEEYRHGKAN